MELKYYKGLDEVRALVHQCLSEGRSGISVRSDGSLLRDLADRIGDKREIVRYSLENVLVRAIPVNLFVDTEGINIGLYGAEPMIIRIEDKGLKKAILGYLVEQNEEELSRIKLLGEEDGK